MNNDNEWSLRDEILATTHRWPVIVAFGLAGILLGLAAAFAWPAPRQATLELYVGLNVYQVAEDSSVSGVPGITDPQFRFADDYKNWQMENLNSLIYTDSLLDEVLSRLRSQDEAWLQVERAQLKEMLHGYWRNAGEWRLVAEHPDAERAAQAVTTWREVIVEQVGARVDAALESLSLDLKTRATQEIQAQATAQASVLEGHLGILKDLRAQIQTGPTDQPLDEITRQVLWEAASQADREAGVALPLDTFPAAGAPLETYIDWLDQAVKALGQKQQELRAQIAALETEKNDLVAKYGAAAQKSLGLSANLVVGKISEEPPQVAVARPTGAFVFIGGMLGLIAWGLLGLARIAMRRKTSTALEGGL